MDELLKRLDDSCNGEWTWDEDKELAAEAIRSLMAALVIWDAAYRTGRNEPLAHAFEVGKNTLVDLK